MSRVTNIISKLSQVCREWNSIGGILVLWSGTGPEPRDFEWSGHSWTAMEVIVMHTTFFY